MQTYARAEQTNALWHAPHVPPVAGHGCTAVVRPNNLWTAIGPDPFQATLSETAMGRFGEGRTQPQLAVNAWCTPERVVAGENRTEHGANESVGHFRALQLAAVFAVLVVPILLTLGIVHFRDSARCLTCVSATGWESGTDGNNPARHNSRSDRIRSRMLITLPKKYPTAIANTKH
jgi:hypothetical protein